MEGLNLKCSETKHLTSSKFVTTRQCSNKFALLSLLQIYSTFWYRGTRDEIFMAGAWREKRKGSPWEGDLIF